LTHNIARQAIGDPDPPNAGYGALAGATLHGTPANGASTYEPHQDERHRHTGSRLAWANSANGKKASAAGMGATTSELLRVFNDVRT
jgi:hypothetical protein